jgi:hypothetical protein
LIDLLRGRRGLRRNSLVARSNKAIALYLYFWC